VAYAHWIDCVSGKTPSFYHMNLFEPPHGIDGWLRNVVNLARECGQDFEPPRMDNVNRLLGDLVHRVRSLRGEIAAMDAAYSLLKAHDFCNIPGTPADRAHLRLALLYQVTDFAAQIGAHRHLKFLIGEIEQTRRWGHLAGDADAIM
jgi:hypothetical protein